MIVGKLGVLVRAVSARSVDARDPARDAGFQSLALILFRSFPSLVVWGSVCWLDEGRAHVVGAAP